MNRETLNLNKGTKTFDKKFNNEIELVKKLVDFFYPDIIKSKFTGSITFKIHFSEGGFCKLERDVHDIIK